MPNSSVTSCMGCYATTQAKCIQTLETLDFDNKRIASRLMKIHPFCKVLILSQDPHHSVLPIVLPTFRTKELLVTFTNRRYACGCRTKRFLHFYSVTSCFKITKSQNSTCNPQVASDPCLTDGVWICILQQHKISYTPILPTSPQYKENQNDIKVLEIFVYQAMIMMSALA